jgi:hypothetical protein
MKVTGAEIIWLFFAVVAVWVALKSCWEALYVVRGRSTDRRGNTLWFYKHVDGLPVGAKNRSQALILTLLMAFFGFLVGLPYLFMFVLRHAK